MNENWKKYIRMFLSAQTISLFGSSLVQYAIIWHITLSSSSGVMMSIATMCGYVPQVLISLFAGVWIDRYHKKVLVMASDAMIAIATLICAIAWMNGYQSYYLLFLLLIVRSIGTGIQTPCVNAMMPSFVPKEELLHYNGINSSLSSLIMFLSPACSGILFSLAQLNVIFFIDVITAILGISITFMIPFQHKKQESASHVLQEAKAGITYLLKEPSLKYLFLFSGAVMFFISPAAFLTPLLIERCFGNDVWRLPISEMMFSFGAVIGGLLIAKLGKKYQHTTLLIMATILYGSMMVGIGVSPIYAVYLFFNGMVGISLPFYNAPYNAILQEQVEEGMLGRVFSLQQIMSALSLPLGTLIFGPLSDTLSVQYPFVVCGCIVVITALCYRKCLLSKGN